MIENKICTKCKVNKNILDFNHRTDKPHLLDSWCKKCKNSSSNNIKKLKKNGTYIQKIFSINRIGEKHITNEGYEVEIIEYFNNRNCTIKFTNSGFIMKNKEYVKVSKGSIIFPFHPNVCGVGYVGIGIYNKSSRTYKKWTDMIQRCYSEKSQEKSPAYKEVTVCEEWKCFQNFAKWAEEIYVDGFDLDKDIKIKGNKIYSPKTCCFVPNEVNCLFKKPKIKKDGLPTGVRKEGLGYRADISKNGKKYYIGNFKSISESFEAYKNEKKLHFVEIAKKWKRFITTEIYNIMINFDFKYYDTN